MSVLTLEERERIAYIEGRVEEAALLAAALHSADVETLELQYEVDRLQTEVSRLEHHLDECDCDA